MARERKKLMTSSLWVISPMCSEIKFPGTLTQEQFWNRDRGSRDIIRDEFRNGVSYSVYLALFFLRYQAITN